MPNRNIEEIRRERPQNYCTACGRTTRLEKLDDDGHFRCTHCGARLNGVKNAADRRTDNPSV